MLTNIMKRLFLSRFKFDDAITAFETTKAGKSVDGKGVIRAIISGPDVSPDEI